MVIARVLSGAAAAGIVPLTMAWIGDTVPYDRRQEILARLLGATVFGMIAGQWLGALVADMFNWRVSFALLAGISLLAGLFVLPESADKPVNGATTGRGFGHRAFDVLSIPWARTVLFVTFIEGALAFSTLSFIPSYLHAAFNLPMSKAGGIVALYGVGGLLYSRCARLLVRRLGESNLARLGGACLTVSYGGLTLVNSWPFAIPACLIAGFGFYALHNTLQTHATQMAPGARGTAVSLFSCFLFFGQSLGVFCAAWFIDRFSAQPTPVRRAADISARCMTETRPTVLPSSPQSRANEKVGYPVSEYPTFLLRAALLAGLHFVVDAFLVRRIVNVSLVPSTIKDRGVERRKRPPVPEAFDQIRVRNKRTTKSCQVGNSGIYKFLRALLR
jgi:predicted MFS family arabinose efflux permease